MLEIWYVLQVDMNVIDASARDPVRENRVVGRDSILNERTVCEYIT